jgi:3-deoxy-D-manno-octulosonic-acid transferase
MLMFYNLIYIVFFICYLPFLLVRKKLHRGFLMRLGIFPQEVLKRLKNRKVIWLHTVSVGEARAAGRLVGMLKQQYPDFLPLISTVTETGNKIARELIGPRGLVVYSPLDTGIVVKRAVNLINPQLFIVAETEIWPNLISCLSENKVPVILVNGRISAGSFKGYKLIRFFLKGVLRKVSLFAMQTKEDAERIILLGADKEKVKVTGSMKFDLEEAEDRKQKTDLQLSEDEKLFIAGSTHRGEEKIVLQVYKELIKTHSDLRLLIAPRHIERTQEIERLVSSFGFEFQRVSDINSASGSTRDKQQVFILDTVGQLRDLYALAEIVFIGGSLVPHGGQNPIEPAHFSRAILFGPYMFNFSDISAAFLDRKAAVSVEDGRQLGDECKRLLNEPGLRAELGERARTIVQGNQGATLRNMELIRGLFAKQGGNL